MSKLKTISLNDILEKEYFNIKDLAQLTKRETNTIRQWETKGIIEPADNRGDNNWRMYSRACVARNLEKLLTYHWKRQVIKNADELHYAIAVLRDQPTGSFMVKGNVR